MTNFPPGSISVRRGGRVLLRERYWGSPEKADPMKAKIPAGRFGRPMEVADLVQGVLAWR